MWAMIEIIAHVLDLRFAAGLFVGFILTFRYIVIGVYHPIIRDMEANNADANNDI